MLSALSVLASLLLLLPLGAGEPGEPADTLVVIFSSGREHERTLVNSLDLSCGVETVLVFARPDDTQLQQQVQVPVHVITSKQGLKSSLAGERYVVVLEDELTYAADWICMAKRQVEEMGRRAVVGAFGAVWNKFVIERSRSLQGAAIAIPMGSGPSDHADVWVDVLQVGSLSFHSSLLERDVLLRLFEAFLSGLPDLHFSTFLHLNHVPRLSFSCPLEWLPSPASSSPPALAFPRRIEELRGETKPALLLALQFAPWRTTILPEPSTFMVNLREEDEKIGWLTYVLVEVGHDHHQQQQQESDCADTCLSTKEDGGKKAGAELPVSSWGSHCEGKLTIVMPVFWKPRACFWQETVRQMEEMEIVDRVLLLWNNPMWSKLSWTAVLNKRREACTGGGWKSDKVVIVDAADRGANRSSLNHRFLPWDEIRTEAVVSMDDDFRPQEDQLRKLLEVWCSFPETLVGPMWLTTRSLACRGEGCQEVTYVTGGWPGYYNLILTGFAIFHRGWLVKYSEEEEAMVEGRRLVDVYGSCEDILLNFLVANETGRAPIAVDVGDVQEIEGNVGLSSISNHFHARSRCSSAFLLPFRNFPLHNNHRGEHRSDFGSLASGQHAAAERAAGDGDSRRRQEEQLDMLRSSWERRMEEGRRKVEEASALLSRIQLTEGKTREERRVVVATVLFASLEYLELQVESLAAFLEEPYTYIAAVDSPSPDLRLLFLRRCVALGVRCHSTPMRDEESLEPHDRPSHGHMIALNWLLGEVVFKEYPDAVLLILDPDVFPIRPFSVFRFPCDGNASCGVFSPRSPPELHPCDLTGFSQTVGTIRGRKATYLHVAVLLLDLPRLPLKQKFSLSPVIIDNLPHDSGGSLAVYFLSLLQSIPAFRVLEYPLSVDPWWSAGEDEWWEEEERDNKLVVCYLNHRYSSDACFLENDACDLQHPGGSERCPAGLPDLVGEVFVHIRKSSGWDEQLSGSSRQRLHSSRMVRMQCAVGYVRKLVSDQLGHQMVDLSENNVGAAVNGGLLFLDEVRRPLPPVLLDGRTDGQEISIGSFTKSSLPSPSPSPSSSSSILVVVGSGRVAAQVRRVRLHGRWEEAKLCLFYSRTNLNETPEQDFSWEPVDFRVHGQARSGGICQPLSPSSPSPRELELASPLELHALLLAPIDSNRSLVLDGRRVTQQVEELQASCLLVLSELELLSS